MRRIIASIAMAIGLLLSSIIATVWPSFASATDTRFIGIQGKPPEPGRIPPADEVARLPLISSPTPRAAELSQPGSFETAPNSFSEESAEPPKRGESQEVWEAEGGSIGVKLFAEPVYYQESGTEDWRRIESRVEPDRERDGWLRTVGNSWVVRFGPIGVDGGGVELSVGKSQATFAPIDVQPVKPELVVADKDSGAGDVVIYRDVLPGADLRYTVSSNGVKEDLILKDQSAATSSIRFRVTGVSIRAAVGDEKTGPLAGTEFVNESGEVLARAPLPTVFDSSGADVTEVSGVVGLAKGDEYVLSVDVDWLKKLSAEQFPVRVDPEWVIGASSLLSTKFLSGGVETACVNPGSGCPAAGMIRIGNEPNPAQRWLARTTYDWSQLKAANPGLVITYAKIRYLSLADIPPTGTSITTYGSVTPFAYSLSEFLNGGPINKADFSGYSFVEAQISNYMQTAYVNGNAQTFAAEYSGATRDIEATMLLGLTPAVSASAITFPIDDSSVQTPTPTLTAAAVPNGNYFFEVSTDPVPGKGVIASSGWTSQSSWALAKGVLEDGVNYHARVYTAPQQSFANSVLSSTVDFDLDLGLGSGGSSPMDVVGSVPGSSSTPAATAPSPSTPSASVSVNMVTGNLSLGVGTHAVGSLDGGISMSMSYNQQAQSPRGLTGRYYRSVGGVLEMFARRRDASPVFDWGYGGPAMSLSTPSFAADWTGFVTVPTTGSWTFGTRTAGKSKVTLDYLTAPVAVVNRWTDHALDPAAVFGAPVSLVAGQARSIKLEFNNVSNSNAAVFQLWVTDPSGVSYPVPADWVSTSQTVLPPGWTFNGDAPNAAWVRLVDQGNDVVATAADGSTTTFNKVAWNLYREEDGGQNLLTRLTAASGVGSVKWIISSVNGQLYTFKPDGSLESIGSAPNDLKPAASVYNYTVTDGTPRLATVTDPVTNRVVTLTYNNGAGNCPTSGSVPAGMLCKIVYWDGVTTTIVYDSAGRVASVQTGGSGALLRSDFGYDSAGRLASIRDPLANDKWAAQVAAGQTPWAQAALTEIAYTTGDKVQTVTQPPPTQGAARPSRTYTYNEVTRATNANIAGITPPGGFASRVTYDTQGRITSQTGIDGITTTTTWNADNQVVAQTDGRGLKTTMFYDAARRLTDTWGPAPLSAFNADGTPINPATVPNQHSGYDEGISGLQATFFNTPDLAGAPDKHGTETFPNGLFLDWGTNAPGASPTDTDWSALYTGEITLPAVGWYSFRAFTRSDLHVVIDDTAVYAGGPQEGSVYYGWWGPELGSQFYNPVAGSKHRIRIEYAQVPWNSIAYGFKLEWRPPTVTQWSTVPAGTTISPRYGLVTTVRGPDNKTVTTKYSDTAYDSNPATGIGPHFGLPIVTTTDPGGLNLQTVTTYEAPSTTTYLRRTAKSLPSGDTTTFIHYNGFEGPIAVVCGVSAATPQAGFVKQQTDPDPDGSGPQLSRVAQFVYDNVGRQVGHRVGNTTTITSAGWKCLTYDTRGRIATESWPARGAAPSRTVTRTYAVGGDPLVNSISDPAGTITSTVDLLNRVTSYSDITGANTTTTTYDQVGRVTQTTGPLGTIVTNYDTFSRPQTIVVDGATLATVAYHAGIGQPTSGKINTVSYGNGTNATFGYDSLGRTNSSLYMSGTQRIAGDQITRDIAGRIVDESYDTAAVNLVDPNPVGPNNTYDNAGRLTSWIGPNNTITYNYTAPSSCSTNSATGKNTNRVSVSNLDRTTNVTATNSFCYDRADRIIAGGPANAVTYDDRGNTLTYNTGGISNTFTWDSADRNIGAASVTVPVTYTRDALDRITQRVQSGTITGNYGFVGASASPALVRNSSGVVIERFYQLPGNVMLTKRMTAATHKWNYPNLHGDTIRNTSDTGGVFATPAMYDPDGNVSWYIDNAAGLADFNWAGMEGVLTEHQTSMTPTVQMGARPYMPSIGRFLSVDSIEGGCANNYVYVYGDPVNFSDYNGRNWFSDFASDAWDNVKGAGTAFVDTFSAIGGTIGQGLSWIKCNPALAIGIGLGIGGFFLPGLWGIAASVAGLGLTGVGTYQSARKGDIVGTAIGAVGLMLGTAGLGAGVISLAPAAAGSGIGAAAATYSTGLGVASTGMDVAGAYGSSSSC
jgi:RHS repeat-associated protein